MYLEDAKWMRKTYILLHWQSTFQVFKEILFFKKLSLLHWISEQKLKYIKTQCICYSHIKYSPSTSFFPAE